MHTWTVTYLEFDVSVNRVAPTATEAVHYYPRTVQSASEIEWVQRTPDILGYAPGASRPFVAVRPKR